MPENVKKTLRQYIWTPIAYYTQPMRSAVSRFLSPVTTPVAAVLSPYRQAFDARWLPFAAARPRLAWVVRFMARTFGWIFGVYLLFIFGLFGTIPSVSALQELQTLNASEVYTADGVLIGRFYKENRKDVKYEEISPYVIHALVATEDERYWEHDGIDYRSLGRVMYRSLLRGDESGGGGSTISQQTAKNLFKRKKYWFLSTPIAKIREMIIASRLERAYSKEELVTLYLNTVPFGGNVFGVQIASKRFFDKNPRDLTTEEAAVLVGMLKANTSYHPIKNPKNAIARRNVVLQQMVNNPYPERRMVISAAEGDSLKRLNMITHYNTTSEKSGIGAYYVDYLRRELPELLKDYKKENGEPYDIYKDGLKIYSTLDSTMQGYAEAACKEQMTKLQNLFDDHWRGQKPWGDDKLIDDAMRASKRYRELQEDGMSEAQIKKNFNTKTNITLFSWKGDDERLMTPLDSIRYYYSMLNVGFMAMDPNNGAIKAWVGGNDFNFLQYDHIRARRQVGSVFKPIVYAQALRSGQMPCEYIPNELTTYSSDGTTSKATEDNTKDKANGNWTPHNADEDYGGEYSMEGALRMSVNVVAARLIHRSGVDAVRKLAKEMGVTNELPREFGIALGAADISLFDMMKVFGTFAARGVRPEPTALLRIETRDKKVVADFAHRDLSKFPRVLTIDQSDIMIKLMRTVVEQGTASSLGDYIGDNTPFAGKTGTTQNHSDGWFIGYNSRLVVGAWVGAESPAVRFRTMSLGQGGRTALPVCGQFLRRVWANPKYADIKNAKFEDPSPTVKLLMDCPFTKGISDDSDTSNYEGEPDTSLIQNGAPTIEPSKLDVPKDPQKDVPKDENKDKPNGAPAPIVPNAPRPTPSTVPKLPNNGNQ